MHNRHIVYVLPRSKQNPGNTSVWQAKGTKRNRTTADSLCLEVIGTHVHHAGPVLVALPPNQAVRVDARGLRVGDQLHLYPSVAHIITHLQLAN